jgi:hypothetical protein
MDYQEHGFAQKVVRALPAAGQSAGKASFFYWLCFM